MHLSRPLVLLALTAGFVMAACGSGTEPRVASEVVVSPSVQTAQTLGQTVQYSAVVRDAQGNELNGRTVEWTSTAPAVATIDAMGLATAVGVGQTTIQATVEAASGTATLSVEPTPSQMQQVAGDGQTAPALSTLPTDPTVRVLDGAGNAIPGVSVVFQVTSGGGVVSPSTATTDVNGDASTSWTLGSAEGTQTLRASVGGLQVDFTVTAEEPLLSVATLVLPDARATLSYDESLDAVGGTPPYSWSLVGGSPPSGISVSGNGDVSGTPGGLGSSAFTVRVTDVLGDTASRTLDLRVCDAPLDLAVGETHLSNPAGQGNCAPFLPSGANGDLYRVGVVRVTLSDGLTPGGTGFLGDVTLDVTEFGGGIIPQVRTRFLRSASTRSVEYRLDAERAAATADFHRRMLLEGERLLAELGREAVRPNAPRPVQQGVAKALLVDPPDRIELKPYPGGTNVCTQNITPVPAQLLAFNEHVAVYQDSTQRAAAPLDVAHAQLMVDYYGAYGQPTIEDYFGTVTDINTDDRVTVFVSPAVAGSVAAFVWPGDFLDVGSCNASNEQELIYFGNDVIAGIADDNFQSLPVLVHEMKHVSSLYRRLVSTFHPVWIEEGSAEIAAEISSRKAMEVAGDVDQGAELTRDAFPASNIADEDNYGVLIRLVRMINSYSSPVNSLTDNPLESSDHTFYGTSWHFHRFLGDAYGDAANKADGALFLQLNDSLTASGTDGFTAVLGESTQVLLEQYAVAMMLNGTGAPQPTRRFTTYDFTTASEILRPEFQPPGTYPWPASGPNPLDFATRTLSGDLAPGGLWINDFESDGANDGIEVRVTTDGGTAARVVIVRVN